MKATNDLMTIGWREWISLPELGIKKIKAKVDTGARTSTLHAFDIETFHRQEQTYARFKLHPLPKRADLLYSCEAKVLDIRWVTDSGGHQEPRITIQTGLCLNGQCWPIEITLVNRGTMRFRMLLGRSALRAHCVVDPSKAFLTRK
jgi:hypothetical protein